MRSTVLWPTEPVEPYLLTKQAGPFMVIAHTFRGPDAVRWAQALAMELRSSHQLMAYIYFKKINFIKSKIIKHNDLVDNLKDKWILPTNLNKIWGDDRFTLFKLK